MPHKKQSAADLSLTDKSTIVAALPTAGRAIGAPETGKEDVLICRKIKRTRLVKDGITQQSASSIARKYGRYIVKQLIGSKVKKKMTSGHSPKRSSSGSMQRFPTMMAKSRRPKDGVTHATIY